MQYFCTGQMTAAIRAEIIGLDSVAFNVLGVSLLHSFFSCRMVLWELVISTSFSLTSTRRIKHTQSISTSFCLFVCLFCVLF